MKARFLFISLVLSISMINAQNDYSKQWEKVEQLEKQSLPQSASEEVSKIYQLALQEGNSPQTIKSLIYQLKYTVSTNKDDFPDKLKELETLAANSRDTTEQSVLYAVISQLYYQYYSYNSYTINQRTPIRGAAPDDIREWSGNLFVQKVVDYALLSVKPAQELQSEQASKYASILNEGKASKELRPTLFDFLTHEAINLLTTLSEAHFSERFYPQTPLTDKDYMLPVKEFTALNITPKAYDLPVTIVKLYQDLLGFRLNAPRAFYMPPNPNNPSARPPVDHTREALLMVDLDRLAYLKDKMQSKASGELYLAALENLREEYQDEASCVEILYRLANYHYLEAQNRDIEQDTLGSDKDYEGAKKAYSLCLEGIERFPYYERIGLLKNLLNNITYSSMQVTAEHVVYPGKDLELHLLYTHLEQAVIEIYRIDAPVTAYTRTWERQGLYKTQGTRIETRTIDLRSETPYQLYDTIVKIPMQDLGVYEYVVYGKLNNKSCMDKDDQDTFVNSQFSVSRLTAVSRANGKQREFLVVDRLSGSPVAGAALNLYSFRNGKMTLKETLKTNKLGLVEADGNQSVDFFNVTYKEDTSLLLSSTPWIQTSDTGFKALKLLTLFTDRSIYRPGQTVYVKGIARISKANQGIEEVQANQKITLVLRDANYKEISKKDFTSNEYGSIAGEFTIPTGLMNGTFTIEAIWNKGNSTTYFQVEEYKRPSLNISFKPVEKTYSFGDKVNVKGTVQSFSGINIQDTEVKYRISRRSHWLSRVWSSEVQINEGSVSTREDGSFSIEFPAEKPFSNKESKREFYDYIVEVTVTNSNGETQTETTTIPVGDVALILSIKEIQSPATSESINKLTVRAKNLSNIPVEVNGILEIHRLILKDNNAGIKESFNKEDWKMDEKVYSTTFTSNQETALQLKKSLPSGRYRIIAKATDEKGREVTMDHDLTLMSWGDKKLSVPLYEQVQIKQTTVSVGEKVEIMYGSAAKDVDVLYEVYTSDQKITQSRFKISDQIKKIEFPYLESYGEQVTVIFTFVKDAKLFTYSKEIRKKQADSRLTLTMETFRDRLLPGQQEEWKINIKDADKHPVMAELLAGMYDASLDKIAPHEWYLLSFSGENRHSLYGSTFREGLDLDDSNSSFYLPTETSDIPEFSFDGFNWFGLNLHQYNGYTYGSGAKIRVRGATSVRSKSATNILAVAEDSSVPAPPLLKETIQFTPPVSIGNMEEAEGTSASEPQIRQNFNETAFFFPQLKTNEAGETLISFTVPESNTTWKFMGLAHTKDMRIGEIVKTAISQKKLMVTPNIPRFMREKDQMTITTNVSNLSEETLTGSVSIAFFEPNSGKTTIRVINASQPFTLEPGKSAPVSWTFEVPSGLDITGVKIVAQTATFSDGEQHVIPILPNRMMVTESLPLHISCDQTKTFKLDKLIKNDSPTRENYRLTLEFASNPMWYAVQALPAMQTPQSGNVVSWFSAYYANSLATALANSTPKVSAMIQIWTKQGETKETLISNLEKNEELKAVLLEETPWVLESSDETEQKQRLALLFDVNRNSYLNQTAINKLQSLQESDGGWSWFKGMRSSVSITQYILYGLGNLSQLGINNDMTSMQKQALTYIDQEFRNHFDRLKKNNKKWKESNSISTYELEYLYVRSYFPEADTKEVREAIDFYTSIIEKSWAKESNLYKRALMATLMQRNGNTSTAKSILKSLREHAVKKDELGMYWANNNTSAFMFQSATALHTFIMEAFQEVGATTDEMDQMKVWLLKQKQTQQWESTPATVNAVNILMKTGSDWLQSDNDVEIRLGNKTLNTASEIGTGYLKESYDASDIQPEMGNVTLTKKDAGPAWGALYWQYFDELDKISAAKTQLNVEKIFTVEKTTSTGKTLVPLSDGTALKVGDKVVVRLTVRLDRDMEYVMLKDMRAACFEPADQLSGYHWKQGVGYYQTTKDASTNFYFDGLPKGTYVFEYAVYVTSPGNYSTGITTIQCLYAPEFVSHTAGSRVSVQ